MAPIASSQPALAQSLAQAAQAWQQGRFGHVVALLEPWDRGPRMHPQVLQLMGLARMRLGQLELAEDCQRRLVETAPEDVGAWINLANTQAALGRTPQALDSLARALALDPRQPAVHFNRGNVLMQQGDHAAACDSFRRAGELAPDRPDPFCNQALALNALARHDEALRVLQSVVARHPGLAVGWNLLGTTWHKLKEADQNALECYQRAVQCDPGLVDAHINAAQVLVRLQRPDEARAAALRAVQLDGRHAVAARTLGVVLSIAQERQEARVWLERAHQLDAHDPVTLGNLLTLDAVCCDWDGCDSHLTALRALWQQGRVEGLESWRLLSLAVDGPELRKLTEMEGARRFGRVPASAPERWRVHIGAPRPARLRIGYFSSDFHHHATSILMAGMFEQHDKSRFETVAFCFGQYPAGPDDPMRQRVRASFDRFELARELSDTDLVALARTLDIHIAVDLKGHTAGNRQGIFAQRMAPVQMHYIGYPGTLGMPGAIDYLVADRIVVPAEHRAFHSESVIELPESYQVNDRARAIDARTPSRAELGLPADAFVFCCFNNNHKITREVFALWMELLRQRPGSVLWLLADNAEVTRNLRAAAAGHGIDPDRLLFAPRAPLPQHLARHAQADLFLDTWPYNAHTTASDALWAGLPVLTCAGQTFASRVAASLLHACGLPQLVTHAPRAYLEQALALSAAPERLRALRRQLVDNRLTVPLFDTERFTRHMERAYDMAWERFGQGLPPDHFAVPPLS
jgi:protein O-GlcNAc transferase